MDTLARYRNAVDRLRRLTAEAGREPESVALCYRVKRYGGALPSEASDGQCRLFSGTTADVVADLEALHGLGVAAIDIDVERADLEEMTAEMGRFQEQVLARL